MGSAGVSVNDVFSGGLTFLTVILAALPPARRAARAKPAVHPGRPVLEIASSPEATTHNVAIGRVESAEVPSTPPHTWLFVAPGP